MYLICRNRVQDFARWKAVFDRHAEAHTDTGLKLEAMWRELDDQNNVFFLFAVEDREKAQAFLDAPESEQAGEEAGVIDGEYAFVESWLTT
jgi:hypothetical protein